MNALTIAARIALIGSYSLLPKDHSLKERLDRHPDRDGQFERAILVSLGWKPIGLEMYYPPERILKRFYNDVPTCFSRISDAWSAIQMERRALMDIPGVLDFSELDAGDMI